MYPLFDPLPIPVFFPTSWDKVRIKRLRLTAGQWNLRLFKLLLSDMFMSRCLAHPSTRLPFALNTLGGEFE